ncbi:hypothetical protein BJV74DRAFT_836625, partial [Russula compacta]
MTMASVSARNQSNGESSSTTLICPAARCPLPAWSRTFSSADALLEHARQTKGLHPLCTTCFRIFKDAAALDQHVEAKHVVVCQPCNRKYKSQSALIQHWRASSAHPNCPVCEAGTADTNALAVHIANAHPKVRCCGTLMNESDLDMHYFNSRNHPACDKCNIGFPTEQEYTEHNSELHSELQCRICAEQFPSAEALRAHANDLTSHRRCEFCSAQFKNTSALVEHFTETHLPQSEVQDMLMLQGVPSMNRSPSPPMNQQQPYVHQPWGPATAVIGAERTVAVRPEPPSRAGTSWSTAVSDIASELYNSPSSLGTFTPSPPSLSTSSSNIFHPQHLHNLPAQPPQPGPPPPNTPPHPVRLAITVPPLPVLSRAVGPVTPARRVAHTSLQSQAQSQFQSQSQSQLQPHQVGPQPPSSARSKGSVAETPSGDLANFHLLKGSPLQSVADFDTPTPSPRTPSMPSVSPAEAQAFALVSHGGGSYLPLAADRRFLPGPSISPSIARAQRAVAASAVVRSSFYCRVCQSDPCREITATACGHVFCNACIVEEVRENARCPVCNAAVLLFALLKLDIS